MFTKSFSLKDLNHWIPIFIPVPYSPYRGSFNPALPWKVHFSLVCGIDAMFGHPEIKRSVSWAVLIIFLKQRQMEKDNICSFLMCDPPFCHPFHPNLKLKAKSSQAASTNAKLGNFNYIFWVSPTFHSSLSPAHLNICFYVIITKQAHRQQDLTYFSSNPHHSSLSRERCINSSLQVSKPFCDPISTSYNLDWISWLLPMSCPYALQSVG